VTSARGEGREFDLAEDETAQLGSRDDLGGSTRKTYWLSVKRCEAAGRAVCLCCCGAVRKQQGVLEVESVACGFFAAGWRDGAAAAGREVGETSPPLGFAPMGLPKSSLLTYLAWTDEMQRMPRLSPSPLSARYAAGGNIVYGDPGGGETAR